MFFRKARLIRTVLHSPSRRFNLEGDGRHFTIVTNVLCNSTLPMVRPLSDGRNYARTTVASPPRIRRRLDAFFLYFYESNRGFRLKPIGATQVCRHGYLVLANNNVLRR